MTGTLRKVQAEQIDLSSPNSPVMVTIDGADTILVADTSDSAISKVTTLTQIKNFATTGIAGGMYYMGVYDASGNVAPSSPTPAQGHYYIISVGGTYDGDTYAIGDWTVYNGASWDKIDNTDVLATASNDGYMSSSDFTKLAGIASGATANTGTVTTVSVATANGFSGTVANATTTPAITIATSVTGLLAGNGTAVSAAASGTDVKTVAGNSVLGSGDVALTFVGGAGGARGLVPTSTAQNVTDKAVLAADGTWVYPGKVIKVTTATIPPLASSVTHVGSVTPITAYTLGTTDITNAQAAKNTGILVTPLLGTSRFVITFTVMLDHNTNGRYLIPCLFVNPNTDTPATSTLIDGSQSLFYVVTADRPASHTITCVYTPGTSVPFYLYPAIGTNNVDTLFMNTTKTGYTSGSPGTIMVIDEIAV